MSTPTALPPVAAPGHGSGGTGATDSRRAVAGLLASLVVVALVTLTPEGTGRAWADPVQEIRWYLTGLASPATLLQWVGNLGLLAVPAAIAAVRWPALTAPGAAWTVALTAAASIEVTQWLLPLGRVVSPVDAVLNATGAVLAVWLVRRARPRARTVRPSSCASAPGPYGGGAATGGSPEPTRATSMPRPTRHRSRGRPPR